MSLGVGDSPGLIQCLRLLLGSTTLVGEIQKSQGFGSSRLVKIPVVHFFCDMTSVEVCFVGQIPALKNLCPLKQPIKN